MTLCWQLEVTISFDIAMFFLPDRAIEKYTLNPSTVVHVSSNMMSLTILMNLTKCVDPVAERDSNALMTQRSLIRIQLLT